MIGPQTIKDIINQKFTYDEIIKLIEASPTNPYTGLYPKNEPPVINCEVYKIYFYRDGTIVPSKKLFIPGEASYGDITIFERKNSSTLIVFNFYSYKGKMDQMWEPISSYRVEMCSELEEAVAFMKSRVK